MLGPDRISARPGLARRLHKNSQAKPGPARGRPGLISALVGSMVGP